MSKRFLAGLLMLVMVLGTMCVPAFAATEYTLNTVFDIDNFEGATNVSAENSAAGDTTIDINDAIASNASDRRIVWGDDYSWEISNVGSQGATNGWHKAYLDGYLLIKGSNVDYGVLKLNHNASARMNLKTITATGRSANMHTEVVRFAISADELSYYEFGYVGNYFDGSNSTVPEGLQKNRPFIARVDNGVRTVIAADTSSESSDWVKWKDSQYSISISGDTITYKAYQTTQWTTGEENKTSAIFSGSFTDTDLLDDFAYPMGLCAMADGNNTAQYLNAGITFTKDKEPVQTPQVFSTTFNYADYTYPTTTNMTAEGIGNGFNAETNKNDLRVAWGDNYAWHFTDGYSTLGYPSQDYVGFNSGGRLIMKGSSADLLALNLEHDDAPYMNLKSVNAVGRFANRHTEIVRVALSADKNSYYEFGVAGEYFDSSSTMPTGITKYRPYVARVVNGTRTVLAAASGSEYIDYPKWNDNHYVISINGSDINYTIFQSAQGGSTANENTTFTGTISDSGFGLLNTFAYPASLGGYVSSGAEVQYNSFSMSYIYGAKSKSFTEDWTAFTEASAKTDSNTDGNCLNFFSSDNKQTVVPGTELNVAWADDYAWKFHVDSTHEAASSKIYMRPSDNPRRTVIIGDAKGGVLTLVHKDNGFMNLENVAVDSLFSRSAGQGIRVAINSDEDTYYELGMNNDTHLPYAAVVVDGEKTILATGSTEYTAWARIHYSFSVNGNTITYKMYQTEQNGTAEIASTEFTGTINDGTYKILAGTVYPVALVGYNSVEECQFEGVSLVYGTDIEVMDEGTSYRVSANTAGMNLSNPTITLVMAAYVEEDGVAKLVDIDYQEGVIGSTPVSFDKSSTPGVTYKIFALDGDMANLSPAASARVVE